MAMTGSAARPFLIGGRWRTGSGRSFDSINPADGSVAATIAEAGPEDVDAAVNAARAAMDNPLWRDMHAHRRARLLHRLADLIERDAEHLAVLQTRDNGKTIAESRHQAAATAEIFRYYAAVCEVTESEVMPHRGNYFSFSLYEPVGVVAALTPWNSPLTLEAQKLAPAIAAGNAVVLKPSEITPQIGLEFGRLALEAGFPAGVLNVLSGYGKTVGQPLVSHPGVDMVTFTGGTLAGKQIAQIAGERLIPAVVELGGKSPNIIFDDANLDEAITGAMFAIFTNCGQSCIAGSRIFVQSSIYDKFVARLVDATRALRVGDPFDAKTAVSPVASFPHRERIEAYIEHGRNHGGHILCGGKRPGRPELQRGAYLEPTIVAVADNTIKLAQEEIFGPVACVLRFSYESDLIHLANQTVFGLSCGIWTQDYKRALRVAKRIKAGTVWINTYKVTSINMPFGGYKASGLWRECGIQGMKFYLETKSVYLNLADGPISWPPKFNS